MQLLSLVAFDSSYIFCLKIGIVRCIIIFVIVFVIINQIFHCVFFFSSPFWKDGRWYLLLVCIFCIFLPALVIFCSHLSVFLEIRRVRNANHCTGVGRQGLKAEIQLFRVCNTSHQVPNWSIMLSIDYILMLQVSFAVCFGFLFAWFPYACLAMYSTFGEASDIPNWMTPLPVLMAKSSIAYNPIIYVMMTKSYRYIQHTDFR